MSAVRWAAAALTAPGESESGDRYVVETFDGGAFIAVIDALGHGHDAASAAAVAAASLARDGAHLPVDATVQRCHGELRSTRGVTVGMAYFDWPHRRMTWLGVGSVTGLLLRADDAGGRRLTSLLVRGGVVGDRLPRLIPAVMDIAPEDTVVIATDGVRSEFAWMLPSSPDPQSLAESIIRDYARKTDDALALVFRCAQAG